jgi:hypothetical protein
MKQTLLYLSICLSLSVSSIYSQSTYSNGLISTGTITKSGVAAPTVPAQHQWSELQNNTGNTTQTNNHHGFDGYYNGTNTDLRVFDDFTVPFSQSWNITSVDVFCYQLNFLGSTPPINVLRVRIWSGFPYLATSTVVSGNMTANVIDVANSQDMYTLRISNSQIPSPGIAPTEDRRIWRIRANITANLTAGVYWIEYQGKAVDNAIFKFIPTTTVGSRGSGNANQYNVISNTFSSLSDTGSPLSAPDVQQNLAFNINYSNPLSTGEIGVESKIKVYPNPVHDVLQIQSGNETIESLKITDISGKIVKEQFLNNETINVENLAQGLYILEVNSDQGRYFCKFVKE